jgi:hypothetical protein
VLEGLGEDLGGEVLGIVVVSHPPKDVGVNGPDIPGVNFLERGFFPRWYARNFADFFAHMHLRHDSTPNVTGYVR